MAELGLAAYMGCVTRSGAQVQRGVGRCTAENSAGSMNMLRLWVLRVRRGSGEAENSAGSMNMLRLWVLWEQARVGRGSGEAENSATQRI